MEKRKSGKIIMQKKVITETISSRRRHKRGDRYRYIEDTWEKNPKTDYTYSRSGSYGSLYLRKGYVSPNMSRRSMHRDLTHSEANSNSSVIVHQDTTITDRLNYSSDDASDEESSQDSARAVKSTSSSVRSRKSMSEQSLSHVTPSNSRLERTFSDSTTRQGTTYGIDWTKDTEGRRHRIDRLSRGARGERQEEFIDSQPQNTEDNGQEYEHGSEKDKRIRYLYDESDDEMYHDGFQLNTEPVVPTVITTVTTVITSVITQLFYVPVRAVASQLYFMSNTQRTDSNGNLSLSSWLWKVISAVPSAVYCLISAPVYGFWYIFTKLCEGLYNLVHLSLRTLSDGLFNIFKAVYDVSSYTSCLLLNGLYYGMNTLHENSSILLSTVFGSLWSLPGAIFRSATSMLIGLYKSVLGVPSIISDGLVGLWDALCHGTKYIMNGVYYSLTAITSGFRQFTSGLFRVDDCHSDEEISQAAQMQYDYSMMEETNRPLGSSGANIGTKYGNSAAKRRSSKRLRLSGKVSDDEIMSVKDKAGQIEVGNEDKTSDMFVVTEDNDADDDNIGLWLLDRIQTIFMFPLSPLSGLLAWLCWMAGSGAYGSIVESVQSDVWLLSRTSRLRRRYGCCCLLPLFLLLPFVLANTYYITERGVAFPPFPILATNNSACCVVQQGTNITDEDLKDKVQTILLGLLADQERRQQQLYANQRKEMNEAQAAALATHRGELEKLVHSVLKDELAAFATAQSNKEQDYVRAREAAEAAAAAAALSETNEADKHYTHLVTQINQMGTKNEGIAADLGSQIAALQTKADALSQELKTAEASGQQLVGAEREAREEAIALLKDQLTSLRNDVASLEAAQAVLLGRMSECCKNDSALGLIIKKAVHDEMALLMGGSSGGGDWFGGGGDAGSSGGFMGWLSSRFAQLDDVDAKIAALAARVTDQIEAIPTTNAQGQPDMMYLHDGVELTAQQVRAMIREALLLYGADKTGQPDYALESAGGSVISTRCSETYHRRTAQLSLFGIPLWYASNSPRSVIQPEVHPGQCWAFKGTQGYLVVQLSGEIYPTAFALEHIPKGLSPTGNIDSAPKDFSVSGLLSDRDTEGILLGNFTYREDGEPLQHFAAKDTGARSFSYVELRIHSNHGNPEYTCLYRFRVHGKLKLW